MDEKRQGKTGPQLTLASIPQIKKEIKKEGDSETEAMNKDADHDHSIIPTVDDETKQAELNQRVPDAPSSPSASKNNESQDRPTVQFPWRLHELLTEAETNGNDSIISWIPGTNNAFKVHNKEKFTKDILPEYFNATKYKSFQRNLNLWGFESITEGPNKGGCQHHIFIRGDREKCHYMTRQKVKAQKQRQQEALAAMSSKDMGSTDLRRNSLSMLTHGLGGGSPTLQASHNAGAGVVSLDGKGVSFCEKLHRVLALPELQGCLRWTSDGRAIAIVNPYQFNGIAVNNFFPGMSLPSFLAELEAYGFRKIAHGGFQDCYYHDMMIQGCQHLCKYISTPLDARRFISSNPSLDLNRGSQTRNVNPMAGNVNPAMSPTTPDQSSLQQLLQLQAAGAAGLGNMLSASQVPQSAQNALSGLALLGGQSAGLQGALNPASLQLLGNNMQNRSTIASYLTELQLRQQQQHQGSGGSAGGAGGGEGGLSGSARGAQV